MKHKYRIIGMSCNGCVVNVESALNELSAVTKVDVDLKNESVIL